MGSSDREGGHPIDSHLLAFSTEDLEAELHDITRLPHMHSETEIKRLFPTIHAAPACQNSFDWQPNSMEETSECNIRNAAGDLSYK